MCRVVTFCTGGVEIDDDWARFGITPESRRDFEAHVEATRMRLASDPDIRNDIAQEMWLCLFTCLAEHPEKLPKDPQERCPYLNRAMTNAALKWVGRKVTDAPRVHGEDRLQVDRVVSYDDAISHE